MSSIFYIYIFLNTYNFTNYILIKITQNILLISIKTIVLVEILKNKLQTYKFTKRKLKCYKDYLSKQLIFNKKYTQ